MTQQSVRLRFAHEEARSLGERVLEVIAPLVERAELAGSIRRRKDVVHDVDIVLIPRTLKLPEGIPLVSPTRVFPSLIAEKVKGELGGSVVVKAGPVAMQMRVLGIPVDFYASTEETWGVNLLRWTGSRAHNIMLCSRARRMGMRLHVSIGLVKGGRVIASRTEEEIFRALDLDWVPPEEREG